MALIDNLISYWKLDESSGNAADAHGSNTLTNNGAASYTPALINNGITFGTPNITKYLSIASDLGITGGAMSVSMWVKMLVEPASNTSDFLFFQADAGTIVGNFMRYEDSSGTKRLKFERLRSGVADDTFTYNITFGLSNFYHVVYAYSGTNLIGYVNGSNIGNVNSSGNGSSSQTDLFRIGASDGAVPSGLLDAIVDEVGVWSRQLTSDEVTSLYNGGAGFAYPFVAAGPTNLKTYNTNVKANIKTMNTNPIANVKTFDTNA